jgi:ubiquinone/menaquinone biosynthesis C-methylase UbiE
MNHHEIVSLIRDGVDQSTVWADFGAGWGNFTRALRELLGNNAVIYAIDRDERAFDALRQQHGSERSLHTITADFTQPLTLPPLDGILMANALHFVREQEKTLELLRTYLKPSGRLILVEYDFKMPRPWVPYPVSRDKFAPLVTAAGFINPRILNTRRSPSTGAEMYAGVAYTS